MCTHPFLVPSVQKQMLLEQKLKLGISANASLPPDESLAFLLAASGKYDRLFSHIDVNLTNFVIADSFVSLRLVHRICGLRQISCGFVESPLAGERVSLPFSRGIVLMTRDFSSPVLNEIKCDCIYFLDLGRSPEGDDNMVQFFFRHGPVPIFRLLSSNSAETSIFCDFQGRPQMTLEGISLPDAERYLRIAALTTLPNRPFSHSPELISVTIPGDVSRLAPTCDEICSDDFWDWVFSPERMEEASAGEWTEQEATDLLRRLRIRGIGEFASLADEIGRSPDEVSAFARSILLFLAGEPSFTETPPLFGSIIFDAFFSRKDRGQLIEGHSYWECLFRRDAVFRTTVYETIGFSELLRANREAYVSDLEANWILRAFIEIRREPYLPLRFMSRTVDPTTAPDFVYQMIRTVINHGMYWPDIQPQFNNFTVDRLSDAFERLFAAVKTDVISFVLHHPEEKNNALLAPIAGLFEQGQPNWTMAEAMMLIRSLSRFGIPSTPEAANWREFHAVTQLVSKTTEQITSFTNIILDRFMRNFQDGAAVSMHNDLTFEPAFVRAMYYRLVIINRVRELLTMGLRHFQPFIGIPDWDIDCDRLLLEGIAQYGSHNLKYLALTNAFDPGLEHFDVIMHGTLARFADRLTSDLPLVRLKEIIRLHHSSRRIAFQIGTARVDFTSAPPKESRDAAARPEGSKRRSSGIWENTD
jgi:hypothetical protein